MTDDDKPEFGAALKLAYSMFRQPLPAKDVLDLWWQKLSPFPVRVVARAFDAYFDEGTRPPVPADILKRCGVAGPSDGRPGAEEAWAIAVRAMDERDTVMMNAEICDAWAAAKPVFDNGDEVGARMAFKEVYVRLVAAIRGEGVPARWWPSLGSDLERRKTALEKAIRDGLIESQAPSALAALAAPLDPFALLAAPVPTVDAREALDGLKSLIKRKPVARSAARTAALEEDRQSVERRKSLLREQAQSAGVAERALPEGDAETSIQKPVA